MTEFYTVELYEHEVPLAEGTCTCGRPVRYNYTIPVIAHIDDGSRCPGKVEIQRETAV